MKVIEAIYGASLGTVHGLNSFGFMLKRSQFGVGWQVVNIYSDTFNTHPCMSEHTELTSHFPTDKLHLRFFWLGKQVLIHKVLTALTGSQ